MKKFIPTIFLITAMYSTGYTQTGNTGIGTSTPGSKLTVNGSLAANYRSEAATTATIGANDFYVVWNAGANGTLTLPAAISGSGNYKGRLYYIKNTTASFNLVLAANGSELIDGNPGISIPSGYGVNIVNTGATSGTTWEVVSFISASIPQFHTSSVVAGAGSVTLTGTTSTADVLPGMSLSVNNPTDQSLNYLINCNIAFDAGAATPLNGAINMYIHMIPYIYVDGVATSFRSFIESEPTRISGGTEASSNFIGTINGTVSLAPGNHTIEVRYIISSFSNLSTYTINQAGGSITATTIY
ncbi:MAG: hypothetical protein HZA79_03640 [Sphingobacteriales bacterium]|nr:hypothetical protein [Sphingobacteriales bacterium]